MFKYLQVFKISFQQEFAYRLNFVMWRVRNVMQIFLVFFLWSTIFSSNDVEFFGYNRDKILTYVFGILLLRAIVLSSRAVDISGEISRGDIINYLLRPVNYFLYWLTRDLSSKALNLGFAIVEAFILYLILKPPFFLQQDTLLLTLFFVSVVIAVLLFFCLELLVNMIPFWVPEAGWAGQYLFVFIFTEALSGAIFPIDILPSGVQQFMYSLPFPYLLFFPLQIYLGKLDVGAAVAGITIALGWLLILAYLARVAWFKGTAVYSAYGR